MTLIRTHRLPLSARPSRLLTRTFTTTPPRPATPFFLLAARSNVRETQHFTSRSGLGVTNHSPAIEAIKASEVDPFAPSSPSLSSASASPPSASSPSSPSSSPTPSAGRFEPPSTISPTASGSSSPRPVGPIEYQARIQAASQVLAGDPRTLNPAAPTDALALNRAAFAVLNAVPGSEAVLSAAAREKVERARSGDRDVETRGRREELGREVRRDFGGAVEMLAKREAGGMGGQNGARFGAGEEGMGAGGGKVSRQGDGAVALMVLVAGLVGANWYAYEMLREERKERERLVGRVQRLEAGRRQDEERTRKRRERVEGLYKRRDERKARREAGNTEAVKGVQIAPREGVRVGPELSTGDKVKGWIESFFWAS
ncbi:GATA type zinc finger protein asd-4 [Elsinoe australis]|uniref:GATA type zinc finger protein asd-4 n=1 Tax=Elsinoe australis TaxID=40998 RepID=A0A2P8A7U9_9PEZI|nr:GATA type zinc finger protein asd-4 [Elsinoe australis]